MWQSARPTLHGSQPQNVLVESVDGDASKRSTGAECSLQSGVYSIDCVANEPGDRFSSLGSSTRFRFNSCGCFFFCEDLAFKLLRGFLVALE